MIEPALNAHRCPTCGSELAPTQPLSVREIVANVLCGSILLAALITVGYTADRWIEVHIRYEPEHWLWHEPLEDWSR
jgi:hypothetical protein